MKIEIQKHEPKSEPRIVNGQDMKVGRLYKMSGEHGWFAIRLINGFLLIDSKSGETTVEDNLYSAYVEVEPGTVSIVLKF